MRTGLSQHDRAPAGAADQSAAVPGHGHAVHAHDGPPAAPEAGAAGQSVPRAAGAGGRRASSRIRPPRKSRRRRRSRRKTEIDWEEILLNGFDVGRHPGAVRGAGVHRAGHGRAPGLIDHLREQLQLMELTPAAAAAGRGVPGQHQRRRLPRRASLEEIVGWVNELLAAHAERPAAEASRTDELAGSRADAGGRRRRDPAASTRSPRSRRCCGSSSGSIRPAWAPAISGSACCCSSGDAARSRAPDLPAGGRGVSRPHRPPLERPGQAVRGGARAVQAAAD